MMGQKGNSMSNNPADLKVIRAIPRKLHGNQAVFTPIIPLTVGWLGRCGRAEGLDTVAARPKTPTTGQMRKQGANGAAKPALRASARLASRSGSGQVKRRKGRG